MENTEIEQLTELFDGLSEYYRQDKLGTMAVRIYFGALDRFSFEQVAHAASLHVSNAKSGQFFPKAADLIRQIEGGEVTGDLLLAAARACNTPLGCMVRMTIGHWDMDCQDSYYLRERANYCLQLLPEWKARATDGNYTDHEISVMLKHDVNPASPFIQGIAAPASQQALLQRAAEISQSPRYLEMIEPPYEGGNDKTVTMHPTVQSRVDMLLEKIDVTPEDGKIRRRTEH